MFKLIKQNEVNSNPVARKAQYRDTISYLLECGGESYSVSFVIEYIEDEMENRRDIVCVTIDLVFDSYTWDYSENEDSQRNYPFAQCVEDAVANDISDEMTPNKIELIKQIVGIVEKYCKDEEVEGLY